MKAENYFWSLVSAIIGGVLFFQFPPMGIAYIIFLIVMLGFHIESWCKQLLQDNTKAVK